LSTGAVGFQRLTDYIREWRAISRCLEVDTGRDERLIPNDFPGVQEAAVMYAQQTVEERMHSRDTRAGFQR
jgi:hypothetical protein